ncbi:hypothetical protein J6590_026310 [Homalodisca vitripennis]|nr:hypothetical protein J6590_026310 [Homalodisca vitripennis]
MTRAALASSRGRSRNVVGGEQEGAESSLSLSDHYGNNFARTVTRFVLNTMMFCLSFSCPQNCDSQWGQRINCCGRLKVTEPSGHRPL